MAISIQPDIYEKISSIQLALLRYKQNGKKITIPVRITVNDDNSLNCVAWDSQPSEKLIDKNVTLIQKDHENYMYIGGRISKEVKKNKTILSISVKKASWFIRKSKGAVTWLQEKCTHLPEMKLAS
jgi:hypothetical protein